MSIILVLAALSLGVSALPYAFAPALSPLWLFLFIPAAFLLLNILFLALLFISCFFLPGGAKGSGNYPWCRRTIRRVLRWLFVWFRVSYPVKGWELMPDCPAVLVSNHRSDFDPMVVLAAVSDRPISFISKESNFRIPIAGPYIRHAGFLPLDREHPLRAARTIKEGARLVKEEGITVGIYPEGTRAKTEELLPFKEGAFVLAKKAEAPIVLFVTPNTEKIARGLPFRPRVHAPIEIIEVIPRETVAERSLAELAEYCRTRIASYLAVR